MQLSNRTLLNSFKSSRNPINSITVNPAKKPLNPVAGKMRAEAKQAATTNPNPPTSGLGSACTFRSLGQSSKLILFAIFASLGSKNMVVKSAIKKIAIGWTSVLIII